MPLASLDTSAGGKYEMYQPDTLEGKNNLAIAQEDGTLLLSIKPADGSLNPNSVFSMNEIILMDRSNQSLLIYIPEIGGTESDTNERYKWDNDGDIQMIKYFYPADDGSVYFCSPDEAKYEQLGQQPEDINNAMQRKGTVLSIRNIARKSAGQILPIPEQVPIRFRIPVVHPLGEGSSEFAPLQGELAIDPVRGMFCFPAQDFLGMNMPAKQYISTSYNYGFPAAIGAGPHDRTVLFGADKKIKNNNNDYNNIGGNNENSPSKKYSGLKKPTIWVTKSLDVVDSDANGNVIFDTLGKALEAAKENGEGEVVIQIQDSALYIEDAIDFQSSAIENLTIQAKNEQRPIVLIKDNGMNIIKSKLKSLTFNGLQIISYDASTTPSFGASTTNTNADTDNAIIKVSSNLSQIYIISSTINPSLKALDFEFEQQEGNDSISADFVIDKSIVGGIDTGTARVNLNINNSIVDDGDKDALVGIRLGCDIDRSTIVGNVSISTLNASETIFEGLVMVKDRQEGCVRYSKYTQNSFLFDWNKVKEQNGDDNEKLKQFLIRNFNDTGWVKDADITNDGKTITIKSLQTTNPKSIMLNLDNEKKGADFVLDNKVYHFAAKMKEGNELGIFAYSIFPRLYRCTEATPLFNSRHPWDPHYLQLNVKCNKDILQGAENKSEMGVYYYGYFSLGVNNFRIKLNEYLPLMLKPAIIMEDK